MQNLLNVFYWECTALISLQSDEDISECFFSFSVQDVFKLFSVLKTFLIDFYKNNNNYYNNNDYIIIIIAIIIFTISNSIIVVIILIMRI